MPRRLHLALALALAGIGASPGNGQAQTPPSKGGDMMYFRERASAYARKGQYDSAIRFYNAGLHRSRQLGSRYWTARYGLWMAGIHTAAISFDSAEHYYRISRPIVEALANDSLSAHYYQNLGALRMYRNDYEEAAENTLRSVDIMERMQDKAPGSLLMSAYSNLSGIFNGSGQPEKALAYDRKALAARHRYADTSEYAQLFFNAAVTCSNLNDLANTFTYLDSAGSHERRYPSPRTRINILGAYGTYYDKRGKPDSALQFTEQALDEARTLGEDYFRTEQAIHAARLHLRTGNTDKARQLIAEALPLAQGFDDYQMMAEAYHVLKDIMTRRGDFRAALRYDDLGDRYADSVATARTRDRILTLEARYENKKKESELNSLQLELAAKELALVKRNRLLLSLGLAAATLLALLYLLYRNSEHRRALSEKDARHKADHIAALERQQQVESMQSLIDREEMERTRIARDLHDRLGGLFSTIRMYFSSLLHDKPDLETEPLFQKGIELVHQASEEVRSIAHNMMPEVLLKIGLVQCTQELCAAISAGRQIKVSFQSYGMDQRLNPSTEILIHRILQELLNNTMKHARATEAIVQFNRVGDRLHITVEDNGVGFTPAADTEGHHTGLGSVRDRVRYLNGHLTIDTEKDKGTTILLDIPVGPNPEA
jgi:signal transduction histidine kinase